LYRNGTDRPKSPPDFQNSSKKKNSIGVSLEAEAIKCPRHSTTLSGPLNLIALA
jgi:hypothetical protein